MSTRVNPVPVFVALATGGFAIGTAEFATMSLLPQIRATLGVDASTASRIISAYALGVVIGAPVITVVAARVARKPLLIALMGVFALGNLLCALAPGFYSMLVFRFLSGLPHGAYFGLASLVAASVVAPGRKTQAVGYVMLGLTLATVVGVPGATWLGTALGWRWGYATVAALAALAALLVARHAPRNRAPARAHPLRELGALANANVWLTLSIGAIGFGGIFAFYTYLTTTLNQITHMPAFWQPFVLAVFGAGMTVSNLVIPRIADRAQMPTIAATLVWTAGALAVYPWAAQHAWSITLDAFCIGLGTAIATILQARLMEIAGQAQNLAAALNHVAFNAANALGPLLAGMVLALGFGLRATGLVGVGLSLAGLGMWALTVAYDRRASGLSRAADH